jgi:hypothetical protein
MTLTYAILYGFSENHHHGKEIEQLLRIQGFVKAAQAAEADIIIAHSAGCYQVPAKSTAQLVFLVGVPMNSDPARKTFIKASTLDIQIAMKDKQLLIKRLRLARHNTGALIRHPRYHRSLAQLVVKNRHVPPSITGPQLIVVSNRYDPWPIPLFDKQHTSSYDASFISLTGAHDHIWQAPEEYVAIINYYAARLFT